MNATSKCLTISLNEIRFKRTIFFQPFGWLIDRDWSKRSMQYISQHVHFNNNNDNSRRLIGRERKRQPRHKTTTMIKQKHKNLIYLIEGSFGMINWILFVRFECVQIYRSSSLFTLNWRTKLLIISIWLSHFRFYMTFR